MLLCQLFDRRRRQLLAAAAGPVGLGIDGTQIDSEIEQTLQGLQGEIGRTHEDGTDLPWLDHSCRSCCCMIL